MNELIANFIDNMRWDWWEAFGLAGEILFFGRILVQWIASEKEKRPILPISYWYMSLIGSEILFFYAMHLRSFVVLLPQLIAFPLYARNLQLEIRQRMIRRMRNKAGFDKPGFKWPTVSVIVPVHNEAKVLADTIGRLLAQKYAGPKPEIVVALNGCTDASWAIAHAFDVKVVESQQHGMSFGKNFGARAANGEVLIFVDADTSLPTDGLQTIVEDVLLTPNAIATVAGRPDKGGPIVRISFMIANRYAGRRKVHAPGGVMAMTRKVFDLAGGFDEGLPQGTSTDMILRACKAGADYIIVTRTCATTSVRRFERRGVVSQMLDWRTNHEAMLKNQRRNLRKKDYDVVR